MKKLAIALAGLVAIGFSGAAFAEDATTGAWSTTSTPATATAPTAMSDSDMDKVTAGLGVYGPQGQGLGLGTFPTLPTLPGQAAAGFQGENYHAADY